MYYKEDELEQFKQYLDENIGKDLISETQGAIQQKDIQMIIPKSELNTFKEVIEKYKTVQYYFTERNDTDYIRLHYLEEYFKNDIEAEMFFKTLKDKMYEISNRLNDRWYAEEKNTRVEISTSYEIDYDIFPYAIKYEEEIAYMIFDKKVIEKAKEIINEVLEENYEIKTISIKNENYEIDGLGMIKINDKTPALHYIIYSLNKKKVAIMNRKNSWQKIFNKFRTLRISCCFYIDNRNEIKLMHTYGIDVVRQRNNTDGWRDDLQRVFLSSWEANLARLFNYKKIKWRYEEEIFELTEFALTEHNNYRYKPDFILEDNSIIEMKGFWDTESLELCYEFQKEYNQYNYCIIDYDMYYTLEKLYSNKIPNWELSKRISKTENGVKLVGITMANRKKYVNELIIGEEVILQRENDNKYDSNAIKVSNSNGNQLGYISKQWASMLSKKMDLGIKYTAHIYKKEPKYIDLKLERVNLDEEILYGFLK